MRLKEVGERAPEQTDFPAPGGDAFDFERREAQE
jgi:hypothetical protein